MLVRGGREGEREEGVVLRRRVGERERGREGGREGGRERKAGLASRKVRKKDVPRWKNSSPPAQ